MALRVGEVNKTIRVSSGGYDMSAYTELEIFFTQPDETQVIKSTADGVIIGPGVTDPDIGVLLPNEYVEYPTEAGFLAEAGETWSAYLQYTNTTTTPPTIYIGDCVVFTVEPVC